MKSKNQVMIKINKEKFIIDQNEFWFFSNMIKKISDYYKIKDNQRKSILLKIPGTGQFRQINYLIFENISNQISRLIKIYKNKLQILDNQ